MKDSQERLDHCLSDEGLGDISSEASSPQPDLPVKTNNSQQSESITKAEKDTDQKEKIPQQDNNDKEKAKLTTPTSPADERMPSRIALSVQTTL